MIIRTLILIFLLSFSHCLTAAQQYLGQTLQVYTHFTSVVGKPTWLLTIRDEQSGQVLPYIFDIRNNNNFWVAFTAGHTYRVTISSLDFGPYAKIKNFCHLENGIITRKSMWITLSGELSPDPNRVRCHVTKYQSIPPPTINNP